jgi:uncharacterized protein
VETRRFWLGEGSGSQCLRVDPCAPAGCVLDTVVNRRFKRWLVLISGWGFVALGVAGLFLPFLQGVLFLLIGVTILSTEYAWARKLLQKLKERFPSLAARLDTAKVRARAWLKRFLAPKSGNAQD